MPWYSDFESICRFDVPLSQLTSFRIGGPARFVLGPRSHAELADVIRCCRDNQVNWRVLGRGANVLASDAGFDGAIVRLSGAQFSTIDIDRTADSCRLRAGGGADLGACVRAAVRGGLEGLEGLAGIPATIGGALRMNAGGRFGQIGAAVSRVLVMHPGGRLQWLDRARAAFGYRTSSLGDYLVLAGEFDLLEEEPKVLLDRYRQVWIYKRQHQPVTQRSAGCIFRNPAGNSAGRLVEQAGCKGLRCGGASVSHLHANFIVAEDGCTAADVLALIRTIKQRVLDQAGLQLRTEIEVWDEPTAEADHKRSCA